MTDHAADDRRLSLLGLPRRAAFERRVVVLPVGDFHRVVASDWRDALVEVEHGEVDLELADGTSRHFATGDVLWLCGLPVRSLRNCGSGVAVLVAVRRRGSRRARLVRRQLSSQRT